MTSVVFLGPTISLEDAREEISAVFLPPVAQGDVSRACLERPSAIGIIDGYFERTPAVWHKEILWAMKEGIHVYGSASMGALRAAELEKFGMVGVGEVFEAFRDGVLDDDDEVAIVHGPAESGYVALSDAMVNIRATIEAAKAANIVSPETCHELVSIAKGLFYADRTYSKLVDVASAGQVPSDELLAFTAWLPGHRVDQKRDDARAMLRLMRARREVDEQAKRVSFTFEHTDLWDVARAAAGLNHTSDQGRTVTVLGDELLDELRLRGDGTYARVCRSALARVLADDEARRLHFTVTASRLEDAADEFRRERGLMTTDSVRQWCDEQVLHLDGFWRLLERELGLRWIEEVARSEVRDGIADELRLTGEYGRLVRRARRKQEAVESLGLQNPSLASIGLTQGELWDWYFRERLGLPAVPDVDAWARSEGFADEESFHRSVVREFCYLTWGDQAVNGLTRPVGAGG